jgi:Zn-finger nucleic acid-binding protein
MTPVCPRDATPLTTQPDALGPGAEARSCPKCAGVLADWKHAQPFFQSLGLTVEDLHSLVRQSAGRPQRSAPVACTACSQGPMRPFTFKGVDLDLCEACGATWLDRGELSRVTQGRLGAAASAAGVPGEQAKVTGVYEMLWDCAHCDAKELLGKTHRYCPGCGAPQDPAARYFPPPGKETVASAAYDGADRHCPACQTPAGAKAQHCRHCGSPLDGAQEVGRVPDRSSAAPKPGPSPSPSGRRRVWPFLLGGALVLCCAAGAVATLWKKDVTVTVTSHAWSREVDVEALQAVQDEAWCDAKPGDAYAVSSRREQRSTRKLADGEDCQTRDVDRGDGTFERRQECKPRYREEPVYDDRCYFTVDRWKKQRTETARGAGTQPAPQWPQVRLSRTGAGLGAEREGPRREAYVLELRGSDGAPYSCTVPLSTWQALADGATRPVRVGVLTGAVDCGQL